MISRCDSVYRYLNLVALQEGYIHPSKYPEFSRVSKISRSLLNSLNILFSNSVQFNKLFQIWQSGSELSFKIKLENIPVIIFFERGNFDSDTLASFNPLTTPYELCLNFSKFDKDFCQHEILSFIQSIKFKSLLAHEIMHFVQTIVYGENEMKMFVSKQNQSKLDYKNSVVEIEACVFMSVFAAKSESKELNNFEDLLEYLNSKSESYYDTAKEIISNNTVLAQDIFDHNINELKESDDDLIPIEFEIEAVDPKTRDRSGLIKSYWLHSTKKADQSIPTQISENKRFVFTQ